MKHYISLNVLKFIKDVYGGCLVVLAVSALAPLVIYYNMNEGLARLFFVSVTAFFSVILSVFYISLSGRDRLAVVRAIKDKALSYKRTATILK